MEYKILETELLVRDGGYCKNLSATTVTMEVLSIEPCEIMLMGRGCGDI